ncbi:hypothetical protein MTO96_047549 [Rhipicephalus appendiculatus]
MGDNTRWQERGRRRRSQGCRCVYKDRAGFSPLAADVPHWATTRQDSALRHRLTSGSRSLDGTPFVSDDAAVFSTLLNTATLPSSTAGTGTHTTVMRLIGATRWREKRHYAASDFLFDDKKARFAVHA